MLSHVRVPYGGHAADFGAGAGHFTFSVAELLKGDGTVYALDAHHGVVDSLYREAARRGYPIRALAADLNAHIPLRDNLLSLGIVSNILHQLSDRERFARELARVTAEGGQALVVDWASSFKNMGPVESAVVSPAEAAALFRNAGFSIGDVVPAGTHHFAFVAVKKN